MNRLPRGDAPRSSRIARRAEETRSADGSPGSPESRESGREPPRRRRQLAPGGRVARGRFDQGVARLVEATVHPTKGSDAVLLVDHRAARLILRQDGRPREVLRFAGFDEPKARASGIRGSHLAAHRAGDPQHQRDNARATALARYYDAILDRLERAGPFLVVGEGPARLELRRRLARRPRLEERLLGVRSAPKRTSDGRLVALLDQARRAE